MSIEIHCGWCGKELDTSVKEGAGLCRVTVEPCELCLEAIREDAYNKGVGEGTGIE